MSTKLVIQKKLPLFLALAASLFSLHLMITQPVDGDIWWLCYVIEQMMVGKTAYKDIVETNPPLVIAMYYPLVALAKNISASPGMCVKAASFIFAIISSALSAKIISHSKNFKPHKNTLFLLFISAFLLIPNMTVDFAQREHIFLIFCLPYLLLSIPSHTESQNNRLCIVAGTLAGIGFSLKPHFLIVFVTVIAARNLLSGKKLYLLNIADFSVLAFGVFYALATSIAFPEFYKFLPFALATYGSHFFSPSFTVLRLAMPLYAVLLTAYFSSPFKNRDLAFLAIVVAAATIELVLQFKPWTYITLPALTLAYILLGLSILTHSASKLRRILNTVVISAFCIIPSLQSKSYAQTGYERCSDYTKQLKALKDAGATSAYAFAESYGCNFPSIQQAGLSWTSRHQSNWMFRGIYGDPIQNPDFTPIKGKEIFSEQIIKQFIEDFTLQPPDILIFDTTENAPIMPRGFNFKNWLKNDENLSTIFKKYTFLKTLNYCENGASKALILCRFDIYVREGISTPSNTP